MASLGPLAAPFRYLRRRLPPLNFITAHWLYFIITCLVSALIFWGSATPFGSIRFIDALFFTVSAMTLAGLNTVNLSELNTFQQFLLFLLIMLGSAIFVSSFVVHVRRKAFEKKFSEVKERREKSRRTRALARVKTWTTKSSNKSSDGKGVGDEEAAVEENDANMEHANGNPVVEKLKEKEIPLSRFNTPPERSGGPEMNRTPSYLAAHPEHADPEQNGDVDPTKPHTAITFRGDTRFNASRQPTYRRQNTGVFSMQGVGARPTTTFRVSTSTSLPSSPSFPRTPMRTPTTTQSKQPGQDRFDITQYFDSAVGWISRNSQFHGLSEAERDKLGGYEYRAISYLAWVVPLYFVLWQLIGCIGCAAWVALNRPDTARENGLNPWWVGAFNAVSAFNNSGMSLLDANMVAFQTSYYMLLTMGLLILAGNTAFPLFLRLIIWCMYKIYCRLAARNGPSSDAWTARANTLRFLLDHPRRCYTNLFPAPHTWWLALALFALNGVDWAAFEILNINNEALDSQVPPLKFRVVDGLFQALAVRSGGFYVVTISTLRIALLVLYVVMMYISVYPVVITMRNSNVYEERTLGIYADEPDPDDDGLGDEPTNGQTANAGSGTFLRRAKTFGNHLASLSVAAPATKKEPINTNFVRHQLRAQLAHDIWFLILALFLIMIIEQPSFSHSPAVFSVFNFVFEIVSAYGCVGISVGVPWAAFSFSGAWHTLSKLILCAVMLRGRHRGLPVAIDKAVLLPGEEQGEAEEEDGRIRIARTMTKERLA